jgi:hypothetical protein
MMEAPDLTPAEFERLLDEETASLEPDVRSTYDQFAVEPVRMTYFWRWGDRRVSKPIWVIARSGAKVLGYDEVEEEFGTGLVRQEGIVEDWGTFGERLRWTLLRFPSGAGPRLGDARPLA